MEKIDLAQVDQLKQIGEYLAQEREKAGMPLQEIALKTYIPLRLLEALESGQVERLPEPVFVQGFIRRYAEMLGLDGNKIAEKFNYQPSAITNPILAPVSESESDGIIKKKVIEQDPITHVSRGWSWPQWPYKKLLLLGSAVVAVFAGVSVVGSMLNSRPNTPEQDAIAPETSSPMASAAPSPAASPLAAPHEVTVTLKETAWLKVVADGKSEFEGILEPGEKRTWTAEKTLEITSGNAGGVILSYNQGTAKPMGELGIPESMTFPQAAADE